MATLKVKRSDRFPVGTTVGAFARAGEQSGQAVAGTAVESAVVDAAGLLEYTALTADVPYALHAEVSGEHRYLEVMASDFTAPGTLAERLATRHATVEA